MPMPPNTAFVTPTQYIMLAASAGQKTVKVPVMVHENAMAVVKERIVLNGDV